MFGTNRVCSLGKELVPCQVCFSEALNGHRKFVFRDPARHRGKLLHSRHLTSLSSESSLLSFCQNRDLGGGVGREERTKEQMDGQTDRERERGRRRKKSVKITYIF